VARKIFERQHRDGLFVLAPPTQRSGRSQARRARLTGRRTSFPTGRTAGRGTVAKLVENATAKDPAESSTQPPRAAPAARRNQERAAAGGLNAHLLRKLAHQAF